MSYAGSVQLFFSFCAVAAPLLVVAAGWVLKQEAGHCGAWCDFVSCSYACTYSGMILGLVWVYSDLRQLLAT
jgi:hypothetical protein